MAQFHFKRIQPLSADMRRFVRQWLAAQPYEPKPPDWYGKDQFLCLTVPTTQQPVIAKLWAKATQDTFTRHGLKPLYVSSPYVAGFVVEKPDTLDSTP
jgi:hypothetical protein